MNWIASLMIFAVLIGCAPVETARQSAPDIALPPMKTFGTTTPFPARYSNATLARDYLDLTFNLENGEKLPVFSRFEGPISVRIDGEAPATLGPDLDRLIARLRNEAGIQISRTANSDAAITIVPVPAKQIRKVAPTAACFVRPNVSSWDEYRARRNDPNTFWTRLNKRSKMAVFLPNDVSPQEMRDCLHEEIAQALGPVNDIYRLSESIFNDDNFHAVLTGYDMMILRVHYDPAFQNGMTRNEIMTRLPGVLTRLNPRGGGLESTQTRLGKWQDAIAEASSPRKSKARRIVAAERAIKEAAKAGPTDPRLAYSHYTLARLTIGTDPDRALKAFIAAGEIYQSRPDTRMQEAHVALQIAAFQVSSGRGDIAVQLLDQNIGAVRQGQHAALLSLMLLLKAEALELEGQPKDATQIRNEALAWARYGFGNEDTIRERAKEIMAISPRTREGNAA